MADPWFSDGLKFTCTECGRCCRGGPGFVWVSDAEVTRLAQALRMDEDDFRRSYTRPVPGRGRTLVEKPNLDCIFYDASIGCSVYEHRPKQCRTWPFWGPNLDSAEAWDEAAAECPGMNDGEHFDADEIQRIAADDGLK